MNWKEQFGGFVEVIRGDLIAVVKREVERFPSSGSLLARFDTAAEQLLAEGVDHIRGFEEIHNELCIAVLILEDPSANRCVSLEYEPTMTACSKHFDFKVTFERRSPAWVEVKTIHPDPIDSWDQYERLQREGRFPDNASLVLDKSWLGGQLFHKYFAARAKLLSYTADTEQKVAACFTASDKLRVFLVFFSNGFDWHVDHLEDFLHLYRHGRHFDGDHFRTMEEFHMKMSGLTFKRNIGHFGYMERRSIAVRPTVGSWDVEPVKWSPIRGFE